MSSTQTSQTPQMVSLFTDDFARIGSNALQQFYDQGQVISRAILDWNAEVGRFVTQRLARTADAIGRLGTCESPPDIISVEAKWLQEAVSDYLNEVSTLAVMNTRIVSSFGERLDQGRKTRSSQ